MTIVTVAIPVFNSAATLERCVRSAMRQTLQDIEIRIADDGSTDASAAIAESLAREDPRVSLLRLPRNGGKPGAMNQLIAGARGRWVAVLDADDTYHPDRLAKLVEAGEAAGADLVADNLEYVDAGADQVVRTAFSPAAPPRRIGLAELMSHSDSYAEFDFGILKPLVRREFVQRHGIRYYEQTRLSEDYYYLLDIFLAGGQGLLLPAPLYAWTMPFGTISRAWTGTGSGAWRYDYRQALAANEVYLARLRKEGRRDVVAMLEARSRQYRVMIHYLAAQRLASEGAWVRSLVTILGHPGTYGLLARRVLGRLRRRIGPARPAMGNT